MLNDSLRILLDMCSICVMISFFLDECDSFLTSMVRHNLMQKSVNSTTLDLRWCIDLLIENVSNSLVFLLLIRGSEKLDLRGVLSTVLYLLLTCNEWFLDVCAIVRCNLR